MYGLTKKSVFYFAKCNGASAHRRTITIIAIYDRNGVYIFLYYIYYNIYNIYNIFMDGMLL